MTDDGLVQSDAMTVLVADDDPAHREWFAKFIGAAGHRVLTAADGEEALRKIAAESTHIVITDWSMPRMDGLELCRRIRHEEGLGFVYIVMLTARNDEERIKKAFDVGVDDFLTKPLTHKELTVRLRAAQRVIRLEADLAKRNREVHLANAQMLIANNKLKKMAVTDELTKLLNRRAAMARLDEQWSLSKRHQEPLSCIMLDVDHFKRFNDTYGHAVGDFVLCQIAEVLRAHVRAGEIVCRIGGEEFLILCSRATAPMAAAGAERLRQAIEVHRMHFDRFDLNVTISIGVAERTVSMSGFDDLLKAADDALYEAKRSGRNRVCIAAQRTPAGTAGGSRAVQTVPIASASRAKVRVLIGDDNEDFRRFCRSCLEREGYEVLEAASGQEVLQKADRENPDLVVIDVLMPDMNGLEATKQLKRGMTTRLMPVIMISGRSSPDAHIEGLEAGADEYLEKPVRPRELVLRISSMVRLLQTRKELQRAMTQRAEQTRALSLLLDFCRGLTNANDLHQILQKSAMAAAELVHCRRVSVMLPDDDGRFLRIAAAIGIEPAIADTVRVETGTGISGRVFAMGQPVVVNDEDQAAAILDQPRDRSFFASVPLISTPLTISKRSIGVLNVTDRCDGAPFKPCELEYLEMIAGITASAVHEITARRSRDEAQDSIVIALAKLAEYRDNDTGRHVDRVTRFCLVLAESLQDMRAFSDQIDHQFVWELERSVPLHDIGKVAIPDFILLKPGALDETEMAIMRTHAEVGAEIIRSVIGRAPGVHFLIMAEQIAHSHHEWFNGAGYPEGLRGEEIPLSARIVALADVYDALTTNRVYKSAIPHDQATAIIQASAGSQYDPLIVRAFLRRKNEFERLAEDLKDDPDRRGPSELLAPALVEAG